MKTNTYKNFLFFISLFIIIGLSFLYFYNRGSIEAASSSLDSSLSDVSAGSITDSQIAKDLSFISSLSSLKSITIDKSFFESQSFKSLKDNNVELESVTPGRPNPFIPVSETKEPATINNKEVGIN